MSPFHDPIRPGVPDPSGPGRAPILDHREHTLFGHILVNGETDFEGLSFGNDSPGGYSTCRYATRINPPSYGSPLYVTFDGQEVWSGKVANTPEVHYTGEKEPIYEVIGEGIGKTDPADQSSDFAMAFVDKNMSNWLNTDCQNWGGANSAYQLTCDSSDSLRISGADFHGMHRYKDIFKPSACLGYKKGTDTVPGFWTPAGDTAGVWTPPVAGIPDSSTAQNDPPTAELARKYPVPPIFWAAFYYVPNEGVTDDRITSVSFKYKHNLLYKKMLDWNATTNPGGLSAVNWDDPSKMEMPPDKWDDPPRYDPQTGVEIYPGTYQDYPDEYSLCPAIPYWSEFHHVTPNPPPCLFGGLYAVDNPEELPVRDAEAMYNHEYVWRWDSHTRTAPAENYVYNYGASADDPDDDPIQYDAPPEGTSISGWGPDPNYTGDGEAPWVWFGDDGLPIAKTAAETVSVTVAVPSKKMLVFYMGYRPIQVPVSMGVTWVPAASSAAMGKHYRVMWQARNQVFLEGGMFINLEEVAVYCNSFSGNDVARACEIIKPGSYPSMIVDEHTSIMVPPFTTRNAALESLFSLYPATTIWGDWGIGIEAAIESRGTVFFDANEPGVSVQASNKMDEGKLEGAVVGGMTVVYSEGHGSSDNRTIHAWTAKCVTIDADGDPLTTNDQKSGYLDLSGTAHSGESATGAGISYILASGGKKTGGGMTWEGTITLRAIYGAVFCQAGYTVNCGDVANAMITSVGVDVDSETTTLSLGGKGYQGRYDPVPGLGPDSATPYQRPDVLPLNFLNTSRRG